VLQYLYNQFKEFDRHPITIRATKLDPYSGSSIVVHDDLDDKTKERLVRVLNFYGRMKPWDLVEMSHEKGGPWHRVFHQSGKVNPGMKIENDRIVEFYAKSVIPQRVQ
jgi:uncharacterized phage-associated protein